MITVEGDEVINKCESNKETIIVIIEESGKSINEYEPNKETTVVITIEKDD